MASIGEMLDPDISRKLAAAFSPERINQRALEADRISREREDLTRQAKLKDLLSMSGTADPAALAEKLGGAGYSDEALKYQAMADAKTMRGNQIAAAREKAVKDKWLGLYAKGMNGDVADEDIAATLKELNANDQQIAAALQDVAKRRAAGQNLQEHFYSLGDPEGYSKIITKRDEQKFRAEESKSARQARMDELQSRLADSRLQSADRMALQRELAQMRIDAQKSALDAKNAPKELAAQQQKEQQSLSAQQAIDQAEKLFSHPGRKLGTGMSSFMGAVPGTDARDFQANLDTFKAQTFVPMVSALKGMGALSDAEGKKLSESVGALNPQMTEKGFEDSLREVTKFLYEKARSAGLNVSLPAFAEQGNPAQTRTSSQKKVSPAAPSSGGFKYLGKE